MKIFFFSLAFAFNMTFLLILLSAVNMISMEPFFS